MWAVGSGRWAGRWVGHEPFFQRLRMPVLCKYHLVRLSNCTVQLIHYGVVVSSQVDAHTSLQNARLAYRSVHFVIVQQVGNHGRGEAINAISCGHAPFAFRHAPWAMRRSCRSAWAIGAYATHARTHAVSSEHTLQGCLPWMTGTKGLELGPNRHRSYHWLFTVAGICGFCLSLFQN